jgi:hypothetical protein
MEIPQALYNPPPVRPIQIKSLPMEIPQALYNPPPVRLIQIKFPMEIPQAIHFLVKAESFLHKLANHRPVPARAGLADQEIQVDHKTLAVTDRICLPSYLVLS